MRSEKSKETLQSATLARVRMFLKADLGWLRGFPLAVRPNGIEWVVVPREDGHEPERIVVSNDHLHRATYRYKRLVAHFPHALPRAVKDIDAWKRGVPFVMEMLKPGIQARRPLPPTVIGIPGVFPPGAARSASDLQSGHPSLGRFINALGYVLLLTPDDLGPALQWTSRHASEIGNVQSFSGGDEGLFALISLWELSRRMRYRDTDFLLRILGDPRASTVPTHGWASHLDGLRRAIVESTKRLSRIKPPEVPRPVLPDALRAFAADALRRPQDVGRRALELLGIVLDMDFLGPWEAAWRRLEHATAARQHLPRDLAEPALRLEVQRYEARIKSLLREQPPEIHIAALLHDVWTISSPGLAPSFAAVCRALRAVPPVHEGASVRAVILHDLADGEKTANPLYAAMVRRFASYLAAARKPGDRLKPWSHAFRDWAEGASWFVSILEDLLRRNSEPSTIEIAFRTLERAAAARPEDVGYEEARTLIALARTLRDSGLAITYAERLAAVGVKCTAYDGDLIRAAHVLAGGGADFGRLFMALENVNAHGLELENLLRLDQDLRDKGWPGLVAEALLSGEGSSVAALASRRKALAALGGACEPPDRIPTKHVPEWIGKYPPEFAEELSTVALLGPEAERAARRIFGQDYVPEAALRAEIAALERRIRSGPETASQAKRLTGLRSRLASSSALSPAKSRRIRTRLDRGVRRAVFALWNRRLDEELRVSIVRTLGTTTIPPEVAAADFGPVLASIMALSRPIREIALEILRRRSGPPPWNLFDHPANRSFLERMSRRGIDMGPWTDAGIVSMVTAKNGKTLSLALVDDPLEIFRMGAYFQTCLSPGGINFYSVVSNAADVNKRVLFARDQAGAVAGRCLFALSERGGILTFHPYCHDRGLGFPEIAAEFAADVALRMNTAVVKQGRVERLVAPKWYDDGPRDTGFRFACLEDGSAFRQMLQGIGPESVAEAAAKAFAPLGLSALTLPPVVMLPELEDRPELIIPLLASLEGCEDVPGEVWARAADLARRAGRLELARRVLDKRIMPGVSRRLRENFQDSDAIKLGLEIDPSAVLRAFRSTRPRGVRTDEEEPRDRREFIAAAHETLGRAALAGRLRLKKDGEEDHHGRRLVVHL